jgi:hypothetical protein
MTEQYILAETPVYVVTKLLKPTKDQLFRNVAVGDQLVFRVPIKKAGSNRGRTYATYITVRNLTTHAQAIYSFNQISHIFDLVEIERSGDKL